MSPLTPADYIRIRVDGQVAWYGRGVLERERRATRLRWLMLAFGGLGTFLAAIGLQLWVALTTALLGAVTTWLAAWQLESTVMLYNQAATDLQAVRDWWLALPPLQQEDPRNVDRLVEGAERIMHAEQSGWVQEMQDAMTQLQLEVSEEERAAAAENAREPGDDAASGSNGSGATHA